MHARPEPYHEATPTVPNYYFLFLLVCQRGRTLPLRTLSGSLSQYQHSAQSTCKPQMQERHSTVPNRQSPCVCAYLPKPLRHRSLSALGGNQV